MRPPAPQSPVCPDQPPCASSSVSPFVKLLEPSPRCQFSPQKGPVDFSRPEALDLFSGSFGTAKEMEPVAHPGSSFLNLSAASQNICPQMKTKSSSWICLRKAFFGCCYGPGLSELFQSSDASSAQQPFSSWAAKPDHDNARKGVRGQSDGRIF